MDKLAGMTQAKWDALSAVERDALRDTSGLTLQLIPWVGWRVEAIRDNGERARFIVGRSTGWRPCHLEIKTRRSMGGSPADKHYQSIRGIERVTR